MGVKCAILSVSIIIAGFFPFECRSEKIYAKCDIKEGWIYDNFYRQLLMEIDEINKSVKIYNHIQQPCGSALWDFESPSTWRDGERVPEGQGVSGAGDGTQYVGISDDNIQYGVIWGGRRTPPMIYNKTTMLLSEQFHYQCKPHPSGNTQPKAGEITPADEALLSLGCGPRSPSPLWTATKEIIRNRSIMEDFSDPGENFYTKWIYSNSKNVRMKIVVYVLSRTMNPDGLFLRVTTQRLVGKKWKTINSEKYQAQLEDEIFNRAKEDLRNAGKPIVVLNDVDPNMLSSLQILHSDQ